MYKYVYKKDLKRLEDGTYKLTVYAEDYYTQQAMDNIIADFTKKKEYLLNKINSIKIDKNYELVVNTMLISFVGSIVILKKLKELNIDPIPEVYDKLTEEEKKQTELPLTKEEIEKYDRNRKFCEDMIKQDIEQSKVQLKEIDSVMPLWLDAVKNGEATSIVEQDLK